MGSFAFTCCISGLPITAGDDVRFLMLTQSAYDEGEARACYIDDRWAPRALPIKAKYNDYGSVEETEKGPIKDSWLEGFQHDLVEKGFGDNTCHDVPIKDDMTFDQFLEALWENRITVYRAHKPSGKKIDDATLERISIAKEKYTPKGMPTIRRIEKLVKGKLSKSYQDGGVIVDEKAHGLIRIRIAEYHENTIHKDLIALDKLIKEKTNFNCMIVPGSGSYSDFAEILVAPKPHKDHSFFWETTNINNKLQISHAMIREDVWQAICKLEIKDYNKIYNLNHFKSKIVEEQESSFLFKSKMDSLKKTINKLKSEKENKEEGLLLAKCVAKCEAYERSVLSSSRSGREIERNVNSILDKKLTKKQKEYVIDTAAELAWISCFMGWSRYTWRPSNGAGPQCAEWKVHKDMLTCLVNIADIQMKQIEEG